MESAVFRALHEKVVSERQGHDTLVHFYTRSEGRPDCREAVHGTGSSAETLIPVAKAPLPDKATPTSQARIRAMTWSRALDIETGVADQILALCHF